MFSKNIIMNEKTHHIASIFVILLSFGYILFIGKSLLVSLIFTIFLFILIQAAYWFFYAKLKNKYISIISCILSVAIFTGIIYLIVSTQVNAFWEEIPRYKEVFTDINTYIQTLFWIQLDVSSLASRINFWNIFNSFSWFASWFLGQIWTIIFLLIFLFIEKNHFIKKIEKICSKKEYAKFLKISKKINDDLSLYFWVKFAMASLNGTVSFFVMAIFGLEYALLFALLIFLFDFIPNIWGIIAMSLPFLFSFTVFDSSVMSFILLWALLVPQTLTWNILEPRLIGTRLNLSGFFILVSLIFWGSLWGVVWAFLAVPMMTSINIILSQFKKTQKIAIMISEKGNI